MLRHRMFRRNERERASKSVVAKLKDTLSVTVAHHEIARQMHASLSPFCSLSLTRSLDHHGDDHSQQLVYHPHHHLS